HTSSALLTARAAGTRHLKRRVTRANFEDLTDDLVEKTLQPVQRALSDADLSANDLDKVLLLGGSTRIPAVQEAIERKLGKEPSKGVNPDEVEIGRAHV